MWIKRHSAGKCTSITPCTLNPCIPISPPPIPSLPQNPVSRPGQGSPFSRSSTVQVQLRRPSGKRSRTGRITEQVQAPGVNPRGRHTASGPTLPDEQAPLALCWCVHSAHMRSAMQHTGPAPSHPITLSITPPSPHHCPALPLSTPITPCHPSPSPHYPVHHPPVPPPLPASTLSPPPAPHHPTSPFPIHSYRKGYLPRAWEYWSADCAQ